MSILYSSCVWLKTEKYHKARRGKKKNPCVMIPQVKAEVKKSEWAGLCSIWQKSRGKTAALEFDVTVLKLKWASHMQK